MKGWFQMFVFTTRKQLPNFIFNKVYIVLFFLPILPSIYSFSSDIKDGASTFMEKFFLFFFCNNNNTW